MKNKVIFIVGPTSSGKSAVAVSVAEKADGEIISSDSMQVYRDMDILTSAPIADLTERVKHHMVGMIPPEEEFSAARFVSESSRLIKSISSDDKTPVVAGGTGLYVKSLIDGIFSSPPKDEELRAELENIAREQGNMSLHARLKEIDPGTAEKLHPNDVKRVIRAIEVYELTGDTIYSRKMDSKGISEKYDCRIFGLDVPRAALYERVNSSVDKMFDDGLVDEVRRLKKRKLSITAGKALGIKEVSMFIDGKLELDKAKDELKKNTRQYAKRQLTWFRADKRIIWIDAERTAEDIARDIIKN